jgi:hypothetical protein
MSRISWTVTRLEINVDLSVGRSILLIRTKWIPSIWTFLTFKISHGWWNMYNIRFGPPEVLIQTSFVTVSLNCKSLYLIEPTQPFTFLSSVTFLCLPATGFSLRMMQQQLHSFQGRCTFRKQDCVVSTSVHSSSSALMRQTNSSIALVYCSFSIF